MQPYFLPYVGYFSLIKHTNMFVLLDVVQFIRHGWIERNRILRQNGGWVYIKVPIIKNAGRATLIKDIRIDNRQNWKEKIFAQLQHYKKIAPYYPAVIKILNDIFKNEYEDIVGLNKAVLEVVCNYLGFKAQISVFSEMSLAIENVNSPDEWALNICKAMGNIKEYWNPEGGQSFFDTNKYTKNGIDVRFVKQRQVQYPQDGLGFEPNLSIIDVLMFHDVMKTNQLIDEFYFL
jgi:hypothetical protein